MNKVVLISTSSRGGAGIAAYRLKDGLDQLGFSVSFLTLKDFDSPILKFLQRVKNNLNRVVVNKRENYELFSTPSTFYRPEKSPLVKDAGILHLHWVAEFINYKSFFERVKNKKIVWTVHDLNMFLGGLHYPGDLKRISPELAKIENKLSLEKSAILKELNITYVFLSNWMKDEAIKLAPWLKEKDVLIIPNGINQKQFQYKDQNTAKKELGFDTNKKQLLFLSDKLSNYRKGMDIILDILDQIDDSVEVHAVGRIPSRRNERVQYHGEVNSLDKLSLFYQAADLCLLPSREDNLPNVMLEALCCGCPVASFNTGGMQDYINNMNGVLSDEISKESFLYGVQKALSIQFDRKQIASAASKEFDIKLSAKRYKELYERI